MPVSLDVIGPMPEGWGPCQACELVMARADLGRVPTPRGLEDLPPEWRADFERLSGLVFDLATRYGDAIVIRIYDPRSLAGLVKAARHRAHRYPTFVVGGQTRITGWEVEALEGALAMSMQERSAGHA